MKKAKSTSDEPRTEYKRSDFGKMERGKYYKRVIASSNVVVMDDEVFAVFPNSAAVNKALHSLVEVAQKASGLTRRSTGRAKVEPSGFGKRVTRGGVESSCANYLDSRGGYVKPTRMSIRGASGATSSSP